MSEPIHPGRWNVDATAAWRSRFSDYDVSRYRHPDASAPTESPSGLFDGARGEPSDERRVIGLLNRAEPLYEAEAVALVVAVARKCAPDVEVHSEAEGPACADADPHRLAGAGWKTVDRVLSDLVLSKNGDIAYIGEPEASSAEGEGPSANEVVGQLSDLLDRLTEGEAVSGELARVRLRIAKEGERIDPAEFADALAPLAAPSLADWLARSDAAMAASRSSATSEPNGSTEPNRSTPVAHSPAAARRGDVGRMGGAGSNDRGGGIRSMRSAREGVDRSPDRSWRLWGLAGAALLGVAAWLAVGLAGSSGSTATPPDSVIEVEVDTEPAAGELTAEPEPLADVPVVAPEAALAADPGPPAESPVDWEAVVAKIDSDRQLSLERVDEESLRRVHAPGSSALRADLRLIEALRTRGLRPVGLVTEVASVVPIRTGVDHAVLRVTDRRSGYDLVDVASGTVRERMPPRNRGTWLLTLSRDAGRWAITAVVTAPT